jgi:hypothetical protein
MLAGFAIYAGALTAFSLSSRERVLARGEEKHFCELDCHLAYSVLNVRKAKTLGVAPEQATAGGIFYVVTVKTRFDEKTVSPRRGDAPLTPNSRVASILDAHGNQFEISIEGQRALASSEGAGMPLTTPLRPGEVYTTDLVFDLPEDAADPRLLIKEGEMVTHFIIGHENSPLHKKTEFSLDETTQAQSTGKRVGVETPAQTMSSQTASMQTRTDTARR